MTETQKIEVVVCMGSSCFSRGNSLTLKLLQNYLHENGFENQIELRGSLCEDFCKCGPTITINGTRYSEVSEAACLQLLAEHLHSNGCREAGPLS